MLEGERGEDQQPGGTRVTVEREGRKEVALESSLILLATFWGADRKKGAGRR